MSAFVLRAVAVIVAVTAIGLATTTSSTAQEVRVTPITISQGATGKVELSVNDIAAPGLGAWLIDLQYDPAIVTPVGCEPHPSGVCNLDFDFGTIRTIGATAEGFVGDTTLASISFECKSVAATALTIIAHEVADATPGDLQPISVTLEHSSAFCANQTPAPTPTPTPEGLLGDVDCNGAIESIDAQLVLQLGGGLIISLPCQENGDVNFDDLINALDAQLILQFVVGFITSFD